MSVVRKLVGHLADSPLVFDGLRWVLEGGFVQHRKLLSTYFAERSQRVLDCGCGTGIYANFFPPDKYVGIDVSPKYIESARRRFPSHEFEVLDATDLRFADESFGEAIVSGVLHHLDDSTVERVCSELRRVLKPGGRLLVWEDVPTRQPLNLVGRFVHRLDLGDHIRTPEAYRQLLARHFEVQSTRDMCSGFMDYAVFQCSRNVRHQAPQRVGSDSCHSTNKVLLAEQAASVA